MRNIHKGQSPDYLEAYRQEETACYEDFPNKKDLLGRLVEEQRGLCCYCMRRLDQDDGSAKIEHWYPQRPAPPAVRQPGRDLEYSNLLAACTGGQGTNMEHCDRAKKNSILNRNPSNPNHDVQGPLHYLSSGKVDSVNDALRQDLEILNLNCEALITQRQYAITTMNMALNKRAGTRSRAAVQALLDDYDGANGGNLKPFCQVAVYLLRKHLQRR